VIEASVWRIVVKLWTRPVTPVRGNSQRFMATASKGGTDFIVSSKGQGAIGTDALVMATRDRNRWN
jgi:hypothetical protein